MRTHRVRPSEKTAFPVICGFSSLGHLAVGWSTPRRGGLRTPASKASRQPSYCLLSATRPSPPTRREWNASAFVGPCHADARSASLRENDPRRYPWVYSPRPLSQASPPRRGGLRTPDILPLGGSMKKSRIHLRLWRKAGIMILLVMHAGCRELFPTAYDLSLEGLPPSRIPTKSTKKGRR